MIYLKDEARCRKEIEIKWLSIAHCLCLLLLPASSEWDDRAAWSMLALNEIKEQITATGQRLPFDMIFSLFPVIRRMDLT